KVGIALVGFTNPQALVSSEGLSIFNASRGIALDDFTLDELRRDLASELESAGIGKPPTLLKEVHTWSSGHPYITARLLGHVLHNHEKAARYSALVAAAVASEFGRVRHLDEPALRHAQVAMRGGGTSVVSRRLDVYQQVLEADEVGLEGEDADAQL